MGVWKIKKKVFPKCSESLPFAKKDFNGKLVSSQKELKNLYLDTFTHRLRHRPMREDYEHLRSTGSQNHGPRKNLLKFCQT